MKVIFVGMHNKPGKMPLCSSTKSGKVIDRIIDGLRPSECLKTNLYDIDYFPKRQEEKNSWAKEWHERIRPMGDDVIVLLGREVHENFIIGTSGKVIKIPHPSSRISYAQGDSYVKSAIAKIQQAIGFNSIRHFPKYQIDALLGECPEFLCRQARSHDEYTCDPKMVTCRECMEILKDKDMLH